MEKLRMKSEYFKKNSLLWSHEILKMFIFLENQDDDQSTLGNLFHHLYFEAWQPCAALIQMKQPLQKKSWAI